MSKWEPKEKRVEDITAAAVEIFLEKGYEGASMDAIAKKAKMSKGGLYHHFGSKDEILYFVNDKLCEPLDRLAGEAAACPQADEGIRLYIRGYIGYWSSRPNEVAFIFFSLAKALSCQELWEIYEAHFNRMKALLAGLYEKGMREGVFREHDPEARAVALLSGLDGVLTYLVMNKGLREEQVISNFEKVFVEF